MKPHPQCRSLRYRRHSPARTRLHRRRITVRHTGSRSRHNRTERSLLSIRGTVSVRHTNRDCDVIRSRQRGANSVKGANPRQLECGSCFDHWLDARFLRLLCRRDGADRDCEGFRPDERRSSVDDHDHTRVSAARRLSIWPDGGQVWAPETPDVDVVAFSILSVASGLAPNFTTFLIVRALFGIAMGGEWGAGTSLVMEKISPKWRGLLSGILQQGYTTGNLLASIAYFFVVPHFGWRALFFVGGAPALLALFIRTNVKESEVWERTHGKQWGELWATIWSNRRVFAYLVLFLTFMGFCGHGTQDMYPTFLKTQRGFSAQGAAVMTMIANLGALVGGVRVALTSDRFGRRWSIACGLGLAGLVIPLWVFSPTIALLAVGAFFIQFGVHGAWGVVPAHISELVPDQIRGFMPGFAYQCGILLAGTITYLQALFGSATSYSNAMALTALVVFASTAAVVSLGPEKKGIIFGK